ncbi:MAG: hypothetical protein CR986_06625 [Ignavibacteriae bacterium]|nr:MAG: hypothetical protein CR986_06625 [Ignavibacteriota bacterium]
MNKEWFKDWFASEHYLDVYKHRNNADTERIINLILSNTKISKGAKILDAACGAGRHSIKFAKEGFDVTGFDLSQTLLNIAERNAKLNSTNIKFLNSDLRSFNTESKFDLIVNLFTSFGYFETDEENFAFIKTAYKLLQDSGYYILDYLNKNYVEHNLIKFTEKKVNGNKIEEHRSINNGRVEKKIIIKKNNVIKEFQESVKLYSYKELISEISKIGFKLGMVFGDYFGDYFEEKKSERCIIIFQK